MGDDDRKSTSEGDSFDEFLKDVARTSFVAPVSSQLHVGEKLLNERVVVIRRIGEGGMGVVYEAFDHDRQEKVALKTLSRVDSSGIYRLKNEFRALVDVAHPNLVRLHDLFRDGDRWFFTMALIRGEPFDQWVRPQGQLDEHRLRSAIAQLVEAVDAIHQSGKLHRDIKPSNVLIDEQGHVTVLDFGLVSDIVQGGVGQTVPGDAIVGTPAYMAPEQAGGQATTAATDFYALGVMLFEALTRKLPFDGNVGEILMSKQTSGAPAPGTLADGLPPDLEELCRRALERDPARRPVAAEFRQAVAFEVPRSSAGQSSTRVSEPLFVGREAELEVLTTAYESTVEGSPRMVLVVGEPGIGKTRLIEHALNQMEARGALTLRGRCRERESVPFKALDGLVDAVGRHLRRLDVEAGQVLPRDAFALRRVFPVLERIDAIAQAPPPAVADDHEIRVRAFRAFGELLARVRDRGPLAVWIDDLQWSDDDSAAMLTSLLDDPDPAPALFIASYRPEGGRDNPVLERLRTSLADNPRWPIDSLEVRALPDDVSEDLALHLLGETVGAAELARAVRRECEGSPLFIAELAHAAATGRGISPDVTLRDALLSRVGALPPRTRKLLELVAVASRPLPPTVIFSALESSGAASALDDLRHDNLVRSVGVGLVECNHDRIREVLVAALPASRLQERHEALARALQLGGSVDAATLAIHLEGAGLVSEAAGSYLDAARAADNVAAFDHAVRYYEKALELGSFDYVRRYEILTTLGDLLGLIGRHHDAGSAYARAAAKAEPEMVDRLRMRSAYHIASAGDLERGRAEMDVVLAHLGLPGVPATERSALPRYFAALGFLRLRGLAFVARRPHTIARVEIERLDTLDLCVRALSKGAPIQAAYLVTVALRRALRVGSEIHVVKFLSHQMSNNSLMGDPDGRWAERTRRELAQLIAGLKGRDLMVLEDYYLRRGMAAVMAGRCVEAGEHFNRGEAILPKLAGSTDRHFIGGYSGWLPCWRGVIQAWSGDLEALESGLSVAFQSALERRDANLAPMAAWCLTHALLARAALDRAERVWRQALALWQDRAETAPHQAAFLRASSSLISLYQGRWSEAWSDAASFHATRGTDRVNAGMIRGRCAVAYSLFATRADGVGAAQAARQALRLLERKRDFHSQGLAPFLRAALAHQAGHDSRGAQVLEASLRDYYEPEGLHLLASIARHRLGVLQGGDGGARLRRVAQQELEQMGVVQAERFCNALAPGFALTSPNRG